MFVWHVVVRWAITDNWKKMLRKENVLGRWWLYLFFIVYDYNGVEVKYQAGTTRLKT